MGARPSVLVVGDTALDVVARHTGPIAHGGDSRARITFTPGGAAANTAAWLAHLGADVALAARVGADAASAQVRAGLTAAGVRCAFTVDPDAATGCVVVLVDETGQRTMLPDRGANARLRGADVDPALLAGARHLHLSGYVLLDGASRPAGLEVLAAARAAGLTTSVDPQSAELIDDPAAFLDAVRGVDLLLPNADESRVLAGAGDPLDVVGAVAVTDGAGGARWISRTETAAVPAHAVRCVDSTGAGDAFDAGLLVAWLSGAGPREALLAGVAAGGAAIGLVGAQP
ncbi:carbohydrate kinase family protein [Actinokineospora iranica]|uniref:Sugar or nucleoside kinase, ribokinase family n=1 Tax=Actinokineospora iranica TaxID=1271860 RepID=A0A1G6LQS9_9PSEU|nr:PfkB family carbohydrate kinase [Actinokineospora iranica]SDC45603.1 Sugar or nucleoside kinase, ribokinase family [Actinokineospora iranica]